MLLVNLSVSSRFPVKMPYWSDLSTLPPHGVLASDECRKTNLAPCSTQLKPPTPDGSRGEIAQILLLWWFFFFVSSWKAWTEPLECDASSAACAVTGRRQQGRPTSEMSSVPGYFWDAPWLCSDLRCSCMWCKGGADYLPSHLLCDTCRRECAWWGGAQAWPRL